MLRVDTESYEFPRDVVLSVSSVSSGSTERTLPVSHGDLGTTGERERLRGLRPCSDGDSARRHDESFLPPISPLVAICNPTCCGVCAAIAIRLSGDSERGMEK